MTAMTEAEAAGRRAMIPQVREAVRRAAATNRLGGLGSSVTSPATPKGSRANTPRASEIEQQLIKYLTDVHAMPDLIRYLKQLEGPGAAHSRKAPLVADGRGADRVENQHVRFLARGRREAERRGPEPYGRLLHALRRELRDDQPAGGR